MQRNTNLTRIQYNIKNQLNISKCHSMLSIKIFVNLCHYKRIISQVTEYTENICSVVTADF